MKSIKDLILDDGPKAIKKREKIFAKDTESGKYYEDLKAEVTRESTMEFPKLKMLVTDSYVCTSQAVFGGSLIIVPISQITNIYRTNIVSGKYNHDYFTLAAETGSGIKYLAVYPRAGTKGLDIFNEIIEVVRSRMALNGGGLA